VVVIRQNFSQLAKKKGWALDRLIDWLLHHHTTPH